MEEIEVKRNTRLDQLLKFAGLSATGGESKLAIQSGEVLVNGVVETRRGYQVKDGDIIRAFGEELRVIVSA